MADILYPDMAKDFQYLNEIFEMVFKQGWTGIIEVDQSGSRWSAKTKSVEKFIIKSLLQQKLKCRVVCGKYTVDGARELWGEFEEEFAYFPEKTFKTNKTERVAQFKGNELKVLGFKSNRSEKVGKLGIKRGVAVDVAIIFVDEVLQWGDHKELSALYQAVGGAKTIIKIRATNPFTPFHWYVAMVHSQMKQSERKMRSEGQQFRSIKRVDVLDDGSEVNKLEVIHYSNHRINEFLSPAQHQELIDTWKTNPTQARVIDWGMMGIEEGAIYSYVIDKMTAYTHDINPKHKHFKGGVDWGVINDATTGHFHIYESEYNTINKWNVVEEFHMSNGRKEYYDSMSGGNKRYYAMNSSDVAEALVNFYIKCREKYMDEDDRIDILVDNSAISFVEMLNAIADRRGLGYEIRFFRGTKKLIKERVRLVLQIASANIFKVDSKCYNLIKELNMAKYADKPSGTNYREGLDHHQDAMEYAISSEWDALINSIKVNKGDL